MNPLERAQVHLERPKGYWNAQALTATKTFYLTLAISLLLIIWDFLLPTMDIIDGSVLTAVGELLMFGVLALSPALIAAARTARASR